MLTLSDAKAMIDEIISEKPVDYSYTEDPKTAERNAGVVNGDGPSNGCFYAHADGSPGCIVGHVIHKLKPEFDLMSIETAFVAHALDRAGIEWDGPVITYLAEIQQRQDSGITWRNATDQVNAMYPEGFVRTTTV